MISFTINLEVMGKIGAQRNETFGGYMDVQEIATNLDFVQ